MSLNMEKVRDRVTTITVLLPQGDSFEVGVRLGKFTQELIDQVAAAQAGGLSDEERDELNQSTVDLFAWWDIVEHEGGPQWPVDLEHARKIPIHVMGRVMEAIVDHTADEGKASDGGSSPKD